MTGRRGFTFIELLVVLVVLGILSGIAVLRYIDLRNEAFSSQVAGELHAVRVGAYNYWADRETWPAEVGAGQVPPELVPYLPGGFSFAAAKYTLDWEHLGGGGEPPTIAIAISSSNPDFMRKLIQRLGRQTPFVAVGGTLTYIISAPNGAI